MQPTKLLLIALLAIPFAGCGLFDEDRLEEALNITYTEDFEIELPIDANALCPAGADCMGEVVESPQNRPLQPIEIAVDLDIVSLTGNAELAQYAGKFRSVGITRIAYAAPNNTLTFDLPPINLYVGPLGTKKGNASGAVKIATIPAIPAKMAASGDAMIDEANKVPASDLVKSLQTALVTDAAPEVKRGQPFPPSGANNLKLTVYVTFTANPADAVK